MLRAAGQDAWEPQFSYYAQKQCNWGDAPRVAVLDEKAAAAQALGIYAAETREAFAPHIEGALATLVAMANYFHDDVRTLGQSSMGVLLSCLFLLQCWGVSGPAWCT